MNKECEHIWVMPPNINLSVLLEPPKEYFIAAQCLNCNFKPWGDEILIKKREYRNEP